MYTHLPYKGVEQLAQVERYLANKIAEVNVTLVLCTFYNLVYKLPVCG